MAQIGEPITRAEFRSMVQPILGLKVSRPWTGYGKVLFLELGTLHIETVVIPRRGPVHSKKGQATLLIHSPWRAETKSGVAFGMDSSEKVLKRGVSALRGGEVTRLALERRLPELEVELDGKLWIRSFRTHGPPDWDLFFRDVHLFPRDPRWTRIDHTLGAGISEGGRLERWMCYDHDAQGPIPSKIQP